MIKKILLLNICILLTSTIGCGSKHKLIQDTTSKQDVLEEIETRKLSEVQINKDTIKETVNWVWEPADSCSTEPVIIIQADGSQIKIPGKGHLRHDKSATHSNTLEKQKDVVASKKKTVTKTKEEKRDKQVQREPFKMPWWIWVVLIAGGLLYWESTKRG